MPPSKPQKLQKLPKNTKITKRPLLRPNIPSPYSGRQNQKVVYVSSKTPFVSAVKRVRRLLYLAEKRDLQAKISTPTSTSTSTSKLSKSSAVVVAGTGAAAAGIVGNSGTARGGKSKSSSAFAFAAVDALNSGVAASSSNGKRRPEEVLVKATGRAIAKAMNLALFFQQQNDCTVVVRTGSVHAIDDIEVMGKGKGGGGEELDAQVDDDDDEDRDDMDFEDGSKERKNMKKKRRRIKIGNERDSDSVDMDIPETRVRQTSVLEVAITLI